MKYDFTVLAIAHQISFLDNNDSYLNVENISSKLKDGTIKTNYSNYFSI